MNQRGYVRCQACGYTRASVIYVPQYRGLRGICPSCDSNWPES